MTPAVVSAVHIYFACLMVAVFFLRAYHLSKLPAGGGAPADRDRLARIFFWDNLSLLVILVVMGTGFWRLLGGLDKPTAYYLANSAFWWKMGLLGFGWAMEMPIAIQLVTWRMVLRAGGEPDTKRLPLMRKLEKLEAFGLPLLILCAALMARGHGQPQEDAAALGTIEVAGEVANLERGAEVYALACQTCHQPDGTGMGGKLAGDFVAQPERLAKPHDALLQTIADGIEGTAMLPWKDGLSETDRRDALGYILARWGPDAAQP